MRPPEMMLEVLRVIAASDRPLTSKDITEHETLRDFEKKSVLNTLYYARQTGRVTVDDERRYTITAKGRALLDGKDVDDGEAPAKPRKPRATASPPPKPVGQALDQLSDPLSRGMHRATERDQQRSCERRGQANTDRADVRGNADLAVHRNASRCCFQER